MQRKRIVIVGGVAAGASCAARARRLDEQAEIIVFERGPHVSFASCGLPYHLGGLLEEDDLVLHDPDELRARYALDVRVGHEVLAIDRLAREVEVREVATGRAFRQPYDALVIATGARPLLPPIPGLDRPGVFTLRDVPDSVRLDAWIDERSARRAVIVGAGPVGLEVAENLHHRGLEVTVLERLDQVLAPLDPEMAAPVVDHLRARGLRVVLGDGLAAIDEDRVVHTTSGARLPADIVLLGLGVRPEVGLAREAGLALGSTGGVRVDGSMRTSDPDIWAIGDVAERRCAVTGQPILTPLAGPAQREGRAAADAICGREAAFRGVQGTFVVGVLGMTAAATGRSAKSLAGDPDVARVWLHPKDHVGWFPGAETMHLQVVYRPSDGRVLGGQAVGTSGVDKRIDVLAMAIQMRATVYDLEQAELAYAPAYGAAKDPVNMAGMIAANHLRGDVRSARWADLGTSHAVLVDVREPNEFAKGHVPGARNVPLSRLREDLDTLPHDRELWLYCASGKRSYDAYRVLAQQGFRVRNLPGGIASWRHAGRPQASV